MPSTTGIYRRFLSSCAVPPCPARSAASPHRTALYLPARRWLVGVVLPCPALPPLYRVHLPTPTTIGNVWCGRLPCRPRMAFLSFPFRVALSFGRGSVRPGQRAGRPMTGGGEYVVVDRTGQARTAATDWDWDCGARPAGNTVATQLIIASRAPVLPSCSASSHLVHCRSTLSTRRVDDAPRTPLHACLRYAKEYYLVGRQACRMQARLLFEILACRLSLITFG
jgi:hypothetical protein